METYMFILVFVLMWIALNRQIGGIEKKLDALKKDIDALKRQGKGRTETIGEELPVEQSPGFAPEEVSPAPDVPEAYISEAFPEEEIRLLPESPVGPTEELLSPVEEEPEEVAAMAEAEEKVVEPAVFHPSHEKKKINYEKYIGENLFGKIGILILVVGVGLFVKYAIDKDWINENFRTVLGFVAGLGLLLVGQRLKEKYRTFSSLLIGGAFAIFYVTVAIAYHYYGIFSQTTGFSLLLSFTIIMTALAFRYDRRELGIIALVGGFIAPFLVSSGEGNYVVLFTYLTILNVSMFTLSIQKKWAELPMIAFVFTYLIMFVYTWHAGAGYNWDGSYEGSRSGLYIKLLLFATLFYFIFLLPVISILKSGNRRMNRLLLWVVVANNFIYIAFGLCYLSNIETPVRLNGLLTLFVAIVNFVLVWWLRKARHDYRFLVYTMLGLVLTFISITVPVQLKGNYITLFWAAEMVLLLWLYVKSHIRVYEYFAALMVGGTLVSYLMDMDFSVYMVLWSGTVTLEGDMAMFMNGIFSTGIFTGMAFLAFAVLMERNKQLFQAGKVIKYSPWNAWMIAIGAAIIYYTFVNEFYWFLPERIAVQMIYLFTAVCVLALSVLLRKRFPIDRFLSLYVTGICLVVGLYLIGEGCRVWFGYEVTEESGSAVIPWLTTLVTAATLFVIGRLYYTRVRYNSKESGKFTVLLNVAAMFFWVMVVSRFLAQLRLPDEFNAGFSIALALAGLVQMGLGMRLHWKLMRVISLFTFGIVLVKLVLSDLWAMPTVGKILVFILLGGILLVLSFLYQKLKDVLFKDDADKE